MKAYKGFGKDMSCRGYRYEEGKEYTHDGKVKCCEGGFHACEYPLDCLGYYPPNESVYHEVELGGTIDKEGKDDTKVAAQKIKIGAQLSIVGLVQAAVDFTFARAKKIKGSSAKKTKGAASSTGNRGAASSTGYQGAASSTGDYGAASSTGDYGAASSTGNQGAASSTGNRGAASAGNPTAIAVAWGRYGKAKGVKGAHIVLAEWGAWNGKEYPLIGAKMAMVDGEKIKEDTYYTLKNGEFVEAEC